MAIAALPGFAVPGAFSLPGRRDFFPLSSAGRLFLSLAGSGHFGGWFFEKDSFS